MANNKGIKRNQNMVAANQDVEEETLFSANAASGFDEIEMGMADDAVELVISMLTDLSADRGAYALRETFSNAYDATVVAGDMTLPIEIELPPSNPYDDNIASALGYDMAGATVTVRDHGCGMTEGDVRSFFTQYGGSKKRMTADVDTIGSKGLGSKAPLAVADTFRVKTVKDGIETTAILERKRGKNWASIKSEPTDKDNGTEVVFPIQDSLVYSQVAKCAEQIARFAIDANVLINGKKSAPAIVTGENTSDYVYLGEITMGTDENGEPASFKLWESTSSFPRRITDKSGVAFSLAGINYTLAEEPRYAYFGNASSTGDTPQFIVEGAPGYLNFTPSRDEIKKDSVREAFLDELIHQVQRLDYSDAVCRKLASVDGYERMRWLFATYDDFKSEDGCVVASERSFRSYNPIAAAVRVPYSALTDDGKPLYRCLLGDEGTKVHFAISGKCFAKGTASGSIESGRRRLAINKETKSEWLSHVLPDGKQAVTVRDAAYDALRRENTSSSSWRRPSYGNVGTPEACVVVYTSENDDETKRFLNCEKSLRALLGAQTVAYALSDTRLTAADIETLEGAFPQVIEYGIIDAIAAAKDYAAKNRKVAAPKGKAEEKIDWKKVPHRAFSVTGGAKDAYDRTYSRSYDMTDAAKDEVVLVPCNMSRKFSDRDVAAQAALVALLHDMGETDAEYAVFCDVKSNQIKTLSEEGWTFAMDLRKNVKTHPACVVDDVKWIAFADDATRTPTVTDAAIAEAEKVDESLAEFIAMSCAAGRFYAETYKDCDDYNDAPVRNARIMVSFVDAFGAGVADRIDGMVESGELDETVSNMAALMRCGYADGKKPTYLPHATVIDEPDSKLGRAALALYRLAKCVYAGVARNEFMSMCYQATDGYVSLLVPGIVETAKRALA